MIRATTPKHIFVFDIDPSEFSRILVTYSQNGQTVLEKTQDDMTFEAETLEDGTVVYNAWYRLTQNETNRFKAVLPACGVHGKKNSKVSIQIRALSKNGEAFASDSFQVDVYDVQNDEVLV